MKNELPFEAFNARTLTLKDVASSFIAPANFSQLRTQNHAILIGPRGSGKTTLMKMLTQEAYEVWAAEQIDIDDPNLPFRGVFIGIEKLFDSQVRALLRDLEGDSLVDATVSIYTLYFVKCFLQAINKIHLVHIERGEAAKSPFSARLSAEKEFVKECERLLQVTTLSPRVSSLSSAVSLKIHNFHGFIRSARGSSNISGELAKHGYSALDVVGTITTIVDILSNIKPQDEVHWALLFDELELAPVVVTERLLDSIRSVSPKIIFKLALSPCLSGIPGLTSIFGEQSSAPPNVPDEQSSATALLQTAQNKQDFTTIRLWSEHRDSNYEFSQKLANSVIQKRLDPQASIESLLGHSQSFEEFSYRPGSSFMQKAKRLSVADEAFKNYLDENGIDLDDEDSFGNISSTLRKVRNLIVFREAFLKAGGARRTRKRPALYSGCEAFHALGENNPRMIIGMLNDLLFTVRNGTRESKQPFRLNAASQMRVYKDTADRFKAYLRTVPASPPDAHGRQATSLLQLVDRVAEYFASEVFGPEFDSDPDLSVRIDASVPKAIQESIRIGLNMGAFVWISADNTPLMMKLVGERIRLSFLLAATYSIPLTVGRDINLTTALERQAERTDATLFE